MKYLLLLLPIFLTSCTAEQSLQNDRAVKKQLASAGIITENLTPEEQGFPLYRFIDINCKDLEVQMSGAISCSMLQRREDSKRNQLNVKTMQMEIVDHYEYYNFIDDHIRYKIIFDSGSMGYYRLSHEEIPSDREFKGLRMVLVDDSEFFYE